MADACLSCGACCAYFRVTFHWSEAEDSQLVCVPGELTERAPHPHRLMMKGTGAMPARCVALEGVVGGQTSCSIHARRPSPCREFTASWSDGVHNPRCDEARAKYGLPALTPQDW